MKGNRSGGFIKLILLIVIVLIVLGFYGYDIRDVFTSPKVHDNLATFWGWILTGWDWLVSHAKALIGK